MYFEGNFVKDSPYLENNTADYKMQQIGWLYEPKANKTKNKKIYHLKQLTM